MDTKGYCIVHSCYDTKALKLEKLDNEGETVRLKGAAQLALNKRKKLQAHVKAENTLGTLSSDQQ